MAARGLFWRTWHRLHNRWLDARAWAVGACNSDTWDRAAASYSGGYPHWRCMRERRHGGSHRFNNYIWAGPGHRVEYRPVEDHHRLAALLPYRKVCDHRHMIRTLRRDRAYRRAAEATLEARRNLEVS